MKAPRREFVVEYKSTRRQIKAQPKSIWGNLDLGAVARQVDADDVLPAEQPIRSEPVETQKVEHLSSSTAVTDPAGVSANVDDRQPIADASSAAVDIGLTTHPEPAIDDSRAAGRTKISPQRTRKRRPLARKPSPHSVLPSRLPDAPSVSTPPLELDDDIVALDAENRRLKRLMADKLRSENEQLRSILDRLEQIPAIYLV